MVRQRSDDALPQRSILAQRRQIVLTQSRGHDPELTRKLGARVVVGGLHECRRYVEIVKTQADRNATGLCEQDHDEKSVGVWSHVSKRSHPGCFWGAGWTLDNDVTRLRRVCSAERPRTVTPASRHGPPVTGIAIVRVFVAASPKKRPRHSTIAFRRDRYAPTNPEGHRKAVRSHSRLANPGKRARTTGAKDAEQEGSRVAYRVMHHASESRASRNTASGWGGIRTPGTVTRTAVFKTAALDHSATHPIRRLPGVTLPKSTSVQPTSKPGERYKNCRGAEDVVSSCLIGGDSQGNWSLGGTSGRRPTVELRRRDRGLPAHEQATTQPCQHSSIDPLAGDNIDHLFEFRSEET